MVEQYSVKLYSRAYKDLDTIQKYISEELGEPLTALRTTDQLENAIFSLSTFPYRGSIRRIGCYAEEGYRQLVVKNYLIIYSIDEAAKEVHIITIRYALSNF